MLKRLLIVGLGLVSGNLIAQTENATDRILGREFRFVIDNDVFTSIYRDQYYTSGLFAILRKIKSEPGDSTKKVRSYVFLHRIYTPSRLSWTDFEDFDRPYAGQVSMQVGNEYYFISQRYIRTYLELGITGPASLTQPIQERWHTILNLPLPEGWKYQISNIPTVNLYVTHAKNLVGTENLDVISETDLSFGTIFNDIRQEFMLRIGKLKPINRSVQYNGVIGALKPTSALETAQEFYFLISPGLEYNIHNSTIEGGFLGGEYPHTEEPVNWIYQNRVGVMMSWVRFDIQVFHYWRTKDTKEAISHTYVGVHLNYRFE